MNKEVSETDEVKANVEEDVLLQWLSADRSEAEVKLENIRRSLVFRFRRYFKEPEDLANEVIYRTYKNLKEGKVNTSTAQAENYISGVATHVKQEKFREKNFIPLSEKIADPVAETGTPFPEELFEAVEKCLGQLLSEEKTLLLNYLLPPNEFSAAEYRQHLSQKLEISLGHLRVKIDRIKKTVRRCVEAQSQIESRA